jgi:hypothetical protein
LLLAYGRLSAQNQEHRVRNVVLVHGAWADGSGWKGVYDILVKDGRPCDFCRTNLDTALSVPGGHDLEYGGTEEVLVVASPAHDVATGNTEHKL